MGVIVKIAWAVLPSILVGVVLAATSRKQEKKDKQDAETQAKRCKQDLLNLNLTVAAAKLSYATAMAMKRGHANGEVEGGVTAYSKAMTELQKFEREQTIDSLAE